MSVASLTSFGMNYSTEMDISVREFFASFEVGESTSSSDLSGRKTHTFHLDLKTGRHVIWQRPAAGKGSSQLPAPQLLKFSTHVRASA